MKNQARLHELVRLIRDNLSKRINILDINTDENPSNTHIESIIDQILRDTCKHVQAGKDILHMIMNVRQIYLRFMRHEPFDLGARRKLARINERGASVDIVSAETVDDILDGLESPFVQDEVAGDDVYYKRCASMGELACASDKKRYERNRTVFIFGLRRMSCSNLRIFPW